MSQVPLCLLLCPRFIFTNYCQLYWTVIKETQSMDSFKLYNNERGLALLLCNWRNFYRVSIKQIHLVSHSQFVLLDPGVLATKENEKLTSENAWWFVDNFICYSWLWGRLALHELCVGFQISPSAQHTFDQVNANVLLLHFSLLVWLKIILLNRDRKAESDIVECEWRLQELLVGKTDQG